MDTLQLVFGLEGDDGPTGEVVTMEVTVLDQNKFVPVAYALLQVRQAGEAAEVVAKTC